MFSGKTNEQAESSEKLLFKTSTKTSGEPSTQKPSQPKTHSTLLDQFEERWIDFNGPVVASVAMVKSLLTIGHLQSHDPILLHRITGYSLRFTSLLVSGLLKNTVWMTFGSKRWFGTSWSLLKTWRILMTSSAA